MKRIAVWIICIVLALSAGWLIRSLWKTSSPVDAQVSCPCSIWTPSTVPPGAADSDAVSVELGLKFRADSDGTITAVRFYKFAPNTGMHTGAVWTMAGALLGSVTFSGETASGWQQATFTTPIAITINTTYVVSYHAPIGRYTGTNGGLSSAIDRPPLHALANGVDGPNGVYAYSSTRTFPTQTFQATNYWVDVVFMPSTTAPPTTTYMPVSNLDSLAWGVYPSNVTVDGFRIVVNDVLREIGKPPQTTCNDSPDPCHKYSLSFLAPGQYRLALVAYNSGGQSAPTETLYVEMQSPPPAAPSGPSNLRIAR